MAHLANLKVKMTAFSFQFVFARCFACYALMMSGVSKAESNEVTTLCKLKILYLFTQRGKLFFLTFYYLVEKLLNFLEVHFLTPNTF